MNLTDRFLDFLYERASAPMPPEAEREARNCLLDELGCMLGGSAQFRGRAEAYFSLLPACDGVTVAGMGRKASPADAALWNGVFSHAFDIDDGHRYSNVHTGASIIPAVLAAAELKDAPTELLLRGIAAGYETAVRLGRCMQPSHRNRGFHASATLCALGAAVGAAVVLDCTRTQLHNVFCAACSNAGGILELQENVSDMKPYNIGRAAAAGLSSALFGMGGFTGPVDPLDGKFGFLRAFADELKPELLTAEPESWAVAGVYHKQHASCRHTHAAIDAVLTLREETPASEVESVTVRMYRQGIKGHDHTEIAGIVAGKMSVPYCIGMSWVLGRCGIPDFTEENRVDAEILRICRATTVVEDPELTALVPGKRVAVIEALRKDGKTVTARMEFPLGEPENPMPQALLEQKFRGLAVLGGKTEKDADAILSLVRAGTGSVRELTALLI